MCPSGGNAGVAAAYAARKLGLKAIIVAMGVTSDEVVALMNQEGAEVIRYGETSDEAIEEAKRVALEKNYLFVHPFDHEIVWQGHSTIVDEILDQLEGQQPSLIVTCCGGGGLFSGIMTGLERKKFFDTGVLVMEPTGASSFYSMTKNNFNPVTVKCNSVAKTLCSVNVCSKAAEYANDERFLVVSKLVSDREAIEAVLNFADQQRILVEASCGTVLAAVYTGVVKEFLEMHRDTLPPGPVILIVCGGNDINVDKLVKWKHQLDGKFFEDPGK